MEEEDLKDVNQKYSSSGYIGKLNKSQEKFTKVFVKGIGETIDDEYLKKWFEKQCGSVQSAEVAKDDYGKFLGYGCVCFCRSQDAERAVRVINNRELNGRTVSVKPFKEKEKHKIPFRNVFVKGFGKTLDDKELRIYFRDQIGDVESAEVAKYENGASKGYGYVSFYKWQDAVKAVHRINGKKVHGNTLIVEPFKPKEERNQGQNRNVYVKGFEEILDDEDLHNLFKIFGEIESAKVERDVNGGSKGYGYVCYSRWEDADTAINKMNGRELGSKVLTVRAFQSREERQKEIKNRNLHIRNLHSSISEEELKKLFEPHGRVRSVHVAASPLQDIKQGHVCLETLEEADEAIAALNGSFYKGLKLKVCVHQDKKDREIGMKGGSCFVPEVRNPEYLRAPSVQSAKKIAGKDKSKSMGNLNRLIPNPKIAAKFSLNKDFKNLESETKGTFVRKERYSYTSVQNLSEDARNERILSYTSKPKRHSTAGYFEPNLTKSSHLVTLRENIHRRENPVESCGKNVIKAQWNNP